MIKIKKTTAITAGSSGLAVKSPLSDLIAESVHSTVLGSYFRFCCLDTVGGFPANDIGTFYVPLGIDLSDVNPSQLQNVPGWLSAAPPELFTNLKDGGAKVPGSVRIALELKKEEIHNALVWRDSPARESLKEQLVHRVPDIEIDNEELVLLFSSAGGATGPATVMHLLSENLCAGKRTAVILINAGNSHNPEWEHRNMIHLLASIAQLGDKAPWVFLLQGESHQRDRVIEGAAYLGQRLAISSTDGFDLTRSLHDGFALARKKFGMPICTVEFNRLESGNAHEKLDILQQLEKQLNG